MFERFTDRARRVIQLAEDEARTLKHQHVSTVHLLVGMIEEGEAIPARIFAPITTLNEVRAGAVSVIPPVADAPTGHLPFTPRAKKVLELRIVSGQVDDDRDLVAFLYLLGRDHLPLGAIEEAARLQVGQYPASRQFTNGHLARWAQGLADRLVPNATEPT